MFKEDHICTALELAEFLNITDRRIQQLANDGVIKKRARGQYLFLESIKSYLKFIQEAAYGDRAIGTDLQAARARESKLKGDKLTLEIAQATGQLVLVDEIESLLTAWATMGRNETLNAFNKIVADIEAKHGVTLDKDALLAHVMDALKAISSYPKKSSQSKTMKEIENGT